MARSALMTTGAPPAREALVDVLAGATGLWDRLTERMTLEMGATGLWAWGGQKYGWEQRFKRGGRPLTTLTPEAGAFTALIVLGHEEADRVVTLPLGDRARRTYDEANPFHDGRWLFLRVETEEDEADVEAILVEKLPPTLRARILTAHPVAAHPVAAR